MPRLKRKYIIEVKGPLGHWFPTPYGKRNTKRCRTLRRARALASALGPGSRVIVWRRFRATAHLGVTILRWEEVSHGG
jgi:hypothetical protein